MGYNAHKSKGMPFASYLALVLSIVIHLVFIGRFALPDQETIRPDSIIIKLVANIPTEDEIETRQDPEATVPEIPPAPVEQTFVEPLTPDSELAIDETPDILELNGDNQAEETPTDSEGTSGELHDTGDESQTGSESVPDTGDTWEIEGDGDQANESKSTPGNEDELVAILEAYKEAVRASITAVKKYPPTAMRLKREGDVEIEFAVGSDGEVSAVIVVSPCPFSDLNAAAVDAVNLANPVPPIPAELSVESMTMSIVLVFNLN